MTHTTYRQGAFGLALSLAFSIAAFAQQRPQVIRGAESGPPAVAGEFKGDVRDLPKVPPISGPTREANPRPARQQDGATWKNRPIAPKVDPLLDESGAGVQTKSSSRLAGPKTVTPGPTILNFDGLPFGGTSNPDAVGDVGPTHYIQMTNAAGGSAVKVFSKTGTSLTDAFVLGTLATPGSRCAVGNGDPIVLYDDAANRWLMSEIAKKVDGQPNFLCVYISKTADPVIGGWWTYQFQTVGFPDYPKYGVWPTAYLVSANEVDGPGGNVASAYALDRSQMLQGLPATSNRFEAPQLPSFNGFNAFIPADLDGANPPPAGAPGYFLRQVDDEFHFSANTNYDYIELWALKPNFTTPANATFTRLPDIRIADLDERICDSGPDHCITQPGAGSQTLDSIPQMTMWRAQYRKFNNLETIVGNFTVDATGADRAGVRWFTLNKIGFLNWSLGQQGTYSPDAAHRWMASIAMDACGNVALGYSVSSTSVFPSIRYVGRLKSDAPGTMTQGEFEIFAGANANNATNRWGDYTSMNVDPSDGSTFWYTNQYMDEFNLWQTRIATFKIGNCQP